MDGGMFPQPHRELRFGAIAASRGGVADEEARAVLVRLLDVGVDLGVRRVVETKPSIVQFGLVAHLVTRQLLRMDFTLRRDGVGAGVEAPRLKARRGKGTN